MFHLSEDKLNEVMKIAETVLSRYEKHVISPSMQSLFHVLLVMSDGKERTWSELQKETPVSPRTLTTVLKTLVNKNLVSRRIIPKFPPRSVYVMTDEYLKAIGHYLRVLDETRKVLFVKSTILAEEMTTPDFVNFNISVFTYESLRLLQSALVEWPPKDENSHYFAYVLVCALIGTVQSFLSAHYAFTMGKRREVMQELEAIITSKMQELEKYRIKSETIRKATTKLFSKEA